MRRLAVIVLLGALAAGCTTTRAAVPVERPALDVPPPPPRSIAPPTVVELERPEPVPELPPERPPAATTKPRPAPAAQKETQKPDAKPEAVEVAAVPPPVQGPPPAPVLRTPATADTVAAERQIRDTMDRAQRGLKGVDYTRLTPERQKAYDQAQDFLTSADTQIKASQYELAKEFAEKAEKLAVELRGR